LSRVAFAFIAFAAISGASAARADTSTNSNSTLKGTFPFNETIIAGVAPAGPGQTQCGSSLATPVQQQLTLTNQGQWTFDGAGHVSIQDTGVLTLLPGTGQYMDVSASAASCAGTYTVTGSTVSMAYTCSLAGGVIQFDVQALGQITPTAVLVAIPPAANGQARILPEYFVAPTGQRTLLACTIVGENTHISLH
jgi:hypothetical protein